MNVKFLLAMLVLAMGAAVSDIASGQQIPPKGLEQQEKVDEPFDDPAYESLCHLFITRVSAGIFKTRWTGSAVLYRGRYLLTAGHNTYQDNSKIRSVEVRCGNANAHTAAIDEKIEGWQALDAPRYRRQNFPRDFGVIRLNRPIAVQKEFELAAVPASPGETIRFAGYPGEKHDGWTLHHVRSARVTRVDGKLVFYDIETYQSNSGGPVWREVDGKRQLVAIHVMPSGGRIVDDGYVTEVKELIAELDRRASERGL